jgi:hypothetical protein
MLKKYKSGDMQVIVFWGKETKKQKRYGKNPDESFNHLTARGFGRYYCIAYIELRSHIFSSLRFLTLRTISLRKKNNRERQNIGKKGVHL